MNKSKQWLNGAKQLCGEFGPEDGIDPRILARSYDRKMKSYKSMQLCKKVKQSLAMILAGELGDPVLQNLEVVDVSSNTDGQFLLVSVEQMDTDLTTSEQQIFNKLQTLQGYLRTEIAASIKRKRVPALKFSLVKFEAVMAAEKESNYAHSENN